MKNNKVYTSILSLITGIVCIIYFSTLSMSVSFSSFFTTPATLVPEYIIFPICALALIVSGLFGILSLSKMLKVIFDCVAVVSAAIAISVSESILIFIPILIIAVIKLLVQILDRNPEKQLFLVMNKPDFFLVFDTKRPTFKEVCERKHITIPERQPKEEKPSKQKKTATVKAAKREKSKKYTGYAISPKARNYRKKAKKKNSKR